MKQFANLISGLLAAVLTAALQFSIGTLLVYSTPGMAALGPIVLFFGAWLSAIPATLLGLIVSAIVTWSARKMRCNVQYKYVLIWTLIFVYTVVLLLSSSVMTRNSSIDAAADKDREATLAFERVWVDIIRSKDSSRCDEISGFREAARQASAGYDAVYDFGLGSFPFESRYSLYASEPCRMILEGNYEFFSNSTSTADDIMPFFSNYQESAWLTIYNARGYEDCMSHEGLTLRFSLYNKEIPIREFCYVKKAMADKNSAYCGLLSVKRNSSIDDIFTKEGCLEVLNTTIPENSKATQWIPKYRRTVDNYLLVRYDGTPL